MINKKSKLAVQVLMILASYFAAGGAHAAEDESYRALDERWQAQVRAARPAHDPRADDDQLRPLVNSDVAIYELWAAEPPFGPLSGGGWQLAGSLVDFVKGRSGTYALYGRINHLFKAGLWNNSLDTKSSFEDIHLLRITAGGAEAIMAMKLLPTTSETRLGLRRSADGKKIEVLRNLPNSGSFEVIAAIPD